MSNTEDMLDMLRTGVLKLDLLSTRESPFKNESFLNLIYGFEIYRGSYIDSFKILQRLKNSPNQDQNCQRVKKYALQVNQRLKTIIDDYKSEFLSRPEISN